jgi:hypothetical protein
MTFALNLLLQKYEQVGFFGIEVSPMDSDVSWFSSGESYGRDQDFNMAALALVYHATSTSSEGDLSHLMETIVSTTPNFTEKDSDFRPPHMVYHRTGHGEEGQRIADRVHAV